MEEIPLLRESGEGSIEWREEGRRKEGGDGRQGHEPRP